MPGAAGVALGVASGRPRLPEEPPVGRKTPPAAIVGGVIGLAIVVALGAWFLLLRPNSNTAVASPSPSPIVVVTPSPEATATDEPTAEPTEDSTPVPTPFQAPTFTGRSLEEAQVLASSGGLELDVRFDTTTSEPDGTVLSQAPPPGSAVLPGDQIFLVVAQPGPTVLVPDILGVAESDAVNLLSNPTFAPASGPRPSTQTSRRVPSSAPIRSRAMKSTAAVRSITSCPAGQSRPPSRPRPRSRCPTCAACLHEDARQHAHRRRPGARRADATPSTGGRRGRRHRHRPRGRHRGRARHVRRLLVSLGIEPVACPTLRGHSRAERCGQHAHRRRP